MHGTLTYHLAVAAGFINSVPVGGATKSYVQQVETNRRSGGAMSSGVGWAASDIDSSIK